MKLLVVAEAPSQKDMTLEGPLSDGNGKFLKAMLRNVGIDPREAKYTSVFKTPMGSPMKTAFGPKAKGVPGIKPIRKGKYILPEYHNDVLHLWKMINHHKPNLVLALGDVSLWATTSSTMMEKDRGYLHVGHSGISDRKIIGTFSPRDIHQSRARMPYWLADLTKAKRQMEFPDIIRPPHEIWIEPTLDDMEEFFQTRIIPAKKLSIDIENKPAFITCIGFATSEGEALVVPFFDSRKPGNCYWETAKEEAAAVRFCRRVTTMSKPNFGHNFIYDMQHMWKGLAIPSPYATDDTMILHHSLQPEMKKGLGVLASIYTDEFSWKGMRTDTMKKEDE